MTLQQLIQAVQSVFSNPQLGIGTGVLGPLQPLLVTFMSNTPLDLTTSNQVVIGVWGTVLAIANAFFLLLVIIGSMHMMVSTSTGTLTIPLSQFVPKILVTAFLMNKHSSAWSSGTCSSCLVLWPSYAHFCHKHPACSRFGGACL